MVEKSIQEHLDDLKEQLSIAQDKLKVETKQLKFDCE